jgi:hypothetical protein
MSAPHLREIDARTFLGQPAIGFFPARQDYIMVFAQELAANV